MMQITQIFLEGESPTLSWVFLKNIETKINWVVEVWQPQIKNKVAWKKKLFEISHEIIELFCHPNKNLTSGKHFFP